MIHMQTVCMCRCTQYLFVLFCGAYVSFSSLFTSLSNSPAALKKTQQHQCGFNMQKTNLFIVSKSSGIGSSFFTIVHKK